MQRTSELKRGDETASPIPLFRLTLLAGGEKLHSITQVLPGVIWKILAFDDLHVSSKERESLAWLRRWVLESD